MKIYSNTFLDWSQILYLSQRARLYPGRWQNYYLYRIRQCNPLILKTYSPVELLQENRYYYCFNHFHRYTRLERAGNKCINSIINNSLETWTYIPTCAKDNDIIVVKSNITPTGALTGPFSSFFKDPVLA
jgi:hypothetical protein